MKRTLFLSTVLVGLVLASCQAQEILGWSPNVHGSIDVAYQSRYIWRGFDVFYQDESAVQITADMTLTGTGFGMSVTGHRANTSGYEDKERWDYNPYYQNTLFADSPIATNYRIGYVYYNYPQQRATASDLQELHAILAWPQATGIQGLVPSYALVKLWSAKSTQAGSTLAPEASGFAHIFMMDYQFQLPGYTADIPELPVRLHSELVYNDGVDPRGIGGVDHDWSNWVIGAATDLDLGYNITLIPAVNYQISMDKSVNPDNETWATISAKWAF